MSERLTTLKLLIAIPSYKRAGEVTASEMFDDYRIFVPPDQADDYRAHHPKKFVVEYPLPEGNIPRKKNWMMKWARENKYEVIFFLDDDYKSMNCNGSGDSVKIIDKDHIIQVIESHAILARDANAPLFTFHNITDIRRYKKNKPFTLFTTFKRGNYGIWLDSTLKFDDRFQLNEDVDLGLQALLSYRKILSDYRYSFAMKNVMGAKGGLSNFRNGEREKQFLELLRSKWGKHIAEKGRSWAERLSNYTVSTENPFV